MPYVTIVPGDCVESLAAAHGFFWDTLWTLPENGELRRRRADPNLLAPGDRLYIPERRTKEEGAPTEARHTFRRKGVPSRLRLRLLRCGRPVANAPYLVTIDGVHYRGRTDTDGRLAVVVPPSASSGTLRYGNVGEEREIPLALGHLDPLGDLSGLRQRLSNLGFACDSETGPQGELTTQALKAFQASASLPQNGRFDPPTRDRLRQLYGC